VLADASTIVRLSLHVLAATIWVGGQFTLAGLVPAARASAPQVLPVLARGFARMAWPAFAVLVASGIWNVAAVDPSKQTAAWRAVLSAKIAVVVLSGVSAWLHQRAVGPRGLAVWGSLSGLSAAAAVVLGVALAG
jgi:putative copper export protein